MSELLSELARIREIQSLAPSPADAGEGWGGVHYSSGAL